MRDVLLLDRRTEQVVRESVPDREVLASLSDYFSMLADSTRIKIISALAITPMCVTDLSNILGINQTTVSHQLKSLRSQRIVNVSRQGKISFYELTDNSILDIMLSAVERVL